jgi:hypothetical protein
MFVLKKRIFVFEKRIFVAKKRMFVPGKRILVSKKRIFVLKKRTFASEKRRVYFNGKEFFMKKTIVATPAIALVFTLIFTACSIGPEPPEPEPVHVHQWQWVITTPATPTADGRETETCKTCGAESGNTRIIEQTEPTVKTFPVSFEFPISGFPDNPQYSAVIKDARTACGKQNLEQLGIVTVIKEAVMGAFNATATNVRQKNMFRVVFGVDGGVTIIVNNSATPYKMSVTDNHTIYFHIDYLKSSPSDIQQNILDTIIVIFNPESVYPHTIQ